MLFEIYTDGSSYIDKDIKCSSSAYQINYANRCLASDGQFHHVGTNNSGESGAVLLALTDLTNRLTRLSDRPDVIHINMYMDSMLVCQTLREWIFKWVEKYGVEDEWISSSKTPVANQKILKEIYTKFLTDSSLHIQFFHINSHVIETDIYTSNMDKIGKYFINKAIGVQSEPLNPKLYEDKKFQKARVTFKNKNNLDISNEDLLRLLYFNRLVDKLASRILKKGLKQILGGE